MNLKIEIKETNFFNKMIKDAKMNMSALVVWSDDDNFFVVRLLGPGGTPSTIQKYFYAMDLLIACEHLDDPDSFFWNNLLIAEYDMEWWEENVQ